MSQTTGCERFEAQCARKARVPQSAEKLTNSNACEPCRHGLAEGARRSAPRRCPRASGRGSTPRSAFAAFCLPVSLSFSVPVCCVLSVSVPVPLMLLLPYCCRRCHFSRCHRLRRFVLGERARGRALRRGPRASGRGSTPRSAFAAFCLSLCSVAVCCLHLC